jgi:hypothetical protein
LKGELENKRLVAVAPVELGNEEVAFVALK